MSVIRHITDLRHRRTRQTEDLDRALDATLAEVDASRGRFVGELAAARALALMSDSEPVPEEGLVALRAGLAARKHAQSRRRRSWVQTGVPSAAAASVVGLLAYAGLNGGGAAHLASPLRGASSAVATIKAINQKMAEVQLVVAQHNVPAAAASANSARQALVEAQQQAQALPADDPVRQLLLEEADTKIAQLTALLAQLDLVVKSLPGLSGGSAPADAVPTASPSSSSTPSSTTPPSTTEPLTTSAPTTTTSSIPKVTTTTTPATTSTTGPGSTTTTTSTTTSTTSPPAASSSTATTSPAAPGGATSGDTSRPRFGP